MLEKVGNTLRTENQLLRCCMAEFVGTFVFLSFALASVAQYVFSDNTFLAVNISFGFGLTMGKIISGQISGGHLNPAVSFALLLQGKLTVIHYLCYVIAQNLGAFMASIMVYCAYLHELHEYKEGMYSFDTAGIFGTFPRNATSYSNLEEFSLIWDQFFASTLFILSILAITDINNHKLPNAINAILCGFSLIIIGSSFGINCGFAVNPARDFAPRLFTLIAGWGWKVFSATEYFSWIPVVMPMVGSATACVVYHLFIGNHWPKVEG